MRTSPSWSWSDELVRPVASEPAEPGADDRERVRVPSSVGPLPARYRPGAGSTWALVVHGRGSERDAAHLEAPLAATGLPTLLLSYRGDPGAPPVPDGLSRLGETEWRDVEAGMAFALAQGARDVVLAGTSQGGGMVVSLLRRSRLARRVRGAVLDAPVLDWRASIALAARRRGLDPLFAAVTEACAAVRAGIDFDLLDHTVAALVLETPILLVHGGDDEIVPVGPSDAFAAARPDLVTYVRVEGAGHVEAFGLAPERCAAALRAFLESLA